VHKGEARFVAALPDLGDLIGSALGQVQREILAAGQCMEQPNAYPGFGHVADNAHEFALSRDQLGRADQQGKARCGAHFLTRDGRLLIQLCCIRSLVHAVLSQPATHPAGPLTGRGCPMILREN